MSESKRRERGANYTPAEKSLLIGLVTQYKDIVDDKNTGSSVIKKKREAWSEITNRYNSLCTTGLRQVDQLKVLYDNLKQKSRKSVGECNKSDVKVTIERTDGSEDPFRTTITNVNEEKVHDGSLGQSKADDSDSKLLAVIRNLLLSHSIDTRLECLQDGLNHNHLHQSASQSRSVTSDDMEVELDPVESDVEHIKAQEKVNKVQKKLANPRTSADTLKRIYYRRKCANARLERRKLMNEIMNQKREHYLKMRILNNKLLGLNKSASNDYI